MLSNILRIVVLSVLITVALNFVCWACHIVIPDILILAMCVGSFAYASWQTHRNRSR